MKVLSSRIGTAEPVSSLDEDERAQETAAVPPPTTAPEKRFLEIREADLDAITADTPLETVVDRLRHFGDLVKLGRAAKLIDHLALAGLRAAAVVCVKERAPSAPQMVDAALQWP